MRVLLVNVNTSVPATDAMVAAASAKCLAGTEVVGLTPSYGASGVDSNTQSLIAGVAVMDAVRRFSLPYDAVVVAGFGEHGREGLQELLDVPVVDITDAAAQTACLLGRRFGVVTTLPRAIPMIEDRLRLAGLDARCAGVRASGVSVR